MILTRFALIALCGVSFLSPRQYAQDTPKPEKKSPSSTLKVQVTFTEYEGEKKLTNLPYIFFVQAGDGGPHSPWTKVRMGNRVPLATGLEGGKISYQYYDVGTNIDARGILDDDDRLDLSLNLERSWVEGEVQFSGEKTLTNSSGTNPEQVREPVIRQFKTELTMPMKDGQTIQTTQAADPVSGRILTITVTMNVVK